MATTQELQQISLYNAVRNGEYWTQTELDSLFTAFDLGASLSDIAYELKRSYYGVATMHSMGKREASAYIERQSAARVSKNREEASYTFLEYNEDWDL